MNKAVEIVNTGIAKETPLMRRARSCEAAGRRLGSACPQLVATSAPACIQRPIQRLRIDWGENRPSGWAMGPTDLVQTKAVLAEAEILSGRA